MKGVDTNKWRLILVVILKKILGIGIRVDYISFDYMYVYIRQRLCACILYILVYCSTHNLFPSFAYNPFTTYSIYSNILFLVQVFPGRLRKRKNLLIFPFLMTQPTPSHP